MTTIPTQEGAMPLPLQAERAMQLRLRARAIKILKLSS